MSFFKFCLPNPFANRNLQYEPKKKKKRKRKRKREKKSKIQARECATTGSPFLGGGGGNKGLLSHSRSQWRKTYFAVKGRVLGGLEDLL